MNKNYIEFDVSTLKDSKGGFFQPEESQQDKKEEKKLPLKVTYQHLQSPLFREQTSSLPVNHNDSVLICIHSSQSDYFEQFKPETTELALTTADYEHFPLHALYLNKFMLPICHTCVEKYPELYTLLTQTEVLQDYLVKKEELKDWEVQVEELIHYSVPNDLVVDDLFEEEEPIPKEETRTAKAPEKEKEILKARVTVQSNLSQLKNKELFLPVPFHCRQYHQQTNQTYLPVYLKSNPLHSTYARMHLYLRLQVEQILFGIYYPSSQHLDDIFDKREQIKEEKRRKKWQEELKEKRKRVRTSVWLEKRKQTEEIKTATTCQHDSVQAGKCKHCGFIVLEEEEL